MTHAQAFALGASTLWMSLTDFEQVCQHLIDTLESLGLDDEAFDSLLTSFHNGVMQA